ncbi:hypothetical protein [Ureibacillus massiliensis]|uniref:hypothetical protein n=1 Tax=Ureibacillus massiliensis TaxID=292806 RepID=UPI00068C425C|nr:hypothetical protein [Ureibacillus massiliensis]
MELVVAIKNNDGTINPQYTQTYSEWIKGNRKMEIVKFLYAENLLKILMDDLGYIQLNEQGILNLKYILEQNPFKTAIRLLGNIAEAIIVNRCNNSKEINRKWATIARKGKKKVKKLDKYIAIGTGLKTTKDKYPTKYDTTNPQRDIIWINAEKGREELLQINENSGSGISAGLQIKVSTSGINYILDDLKKCRYEVPMVYFGLNDDFDEVAYHLYNHKTHLEIGKDFINVKAFDIDAYEELKSYKPLIIGLLNNTIKIEDLLNERILEDTVIKSAFTKVGFQSTFSGNNIIMTSNQIYI